MALVLRSYLKTQKNMLNVASVSFSSSLSNVFRRPFSDDTTRDHPEFSSSTILVENGFNVQELPVVVRKLTSLEMESEPASEPTRNTSESLNYHLIQSEFKQCVDLRDVFSLLSKCTKITPNIALGAMERIYDLEKEPNTFLIDNKNVHINLAKGAILDKLIKVVMKTEDTNTILNVLKSVSSFMEPYKSKFCDELLIRTLDNKLSVEQMCTFINFLIENKNIVKYSDTIDKLWVGFIQKEEEINETNIVQIFSILPGLKASKKIVLTLLEQKFSHLWSKITVPIMQDILSAFVEEKYLSVQSFAVVGTWLGKNIHAVDDDSLLDIITKLTRLNYTDDQIENAVEKYMRLKHSKITSHVLIVGVLNYCMQFQIRNEHILNTCSQYFLRNGRAVPPSFLKSFIFPFGYLSYCPGHMQEYWSFAEEVVFENFDKISADNVCSIILSHIYASKYPLQLVSRVFSPEYLVKVKPEVLSRLHLVDTALSLECEDYSGPLMPKDQWSKPISQDRRIKNIIDKVMDSFIDVAGDPNKLSTGVLIPHFYSDQTYLIDVMLHPAGLGSKTFNWKSKSARNDIIAILIHLPDHYCSDNEQLVGPQMMRKKHLKILGMRVVSLKYSMLSQFYTSFNSSGLKQYLRDSISDAEPCL